MRRRRGDENIERLPFSTRFEEIRRKCARFVEDHAEAIRAARPTVPGTLNDRAADNWLALLTLADLAGGDWPSLAREAALKLSGAEEAGLGTNAQLLDDIRRIFTELNADRLTSKDLCERLAEIEGRQWAEFGKNQKPMTPNQLANLLREFQVVSRTIRIGDGTLKGYLLDDFEDAFSRYPSETGFSNRNNVTEAASIDQNTVFGDATREKCCVSENARIPNADRGCDVVTPRNGETSPEWLYV